LEGRVRIILNSDVIHTDRRWADGLPGHIEWFCRAAAAAGATIVLPRTALLEDERHQTTLDNARLQEAEEAIAILKGMNVPLPEIEIPTVPAVGAADAFRAIGVVVEVEEPILEDYREAEKRAALHLAPHPPEGTSDEMRDLVIWQVALRIAKRDGGAFMVSRDEVHAHERGAAEAAVARLYRASNFQDAVELLLQKSPVAVLEALRKVAAERLFRRPKVRDGAKTQTERAAASQVARALGESRLESEGLDARVLGFVSYLGDPTKEQLLSMLARSGVKSELAKNVADKLVIAGILVDTGNHYLVKDKNAGEAAEVLVEAEIIKLLEQG
jgi:hypothetical protein